MRFLQRRRKIQMQMMIEDQKPNHQEHSDSVIRYLEALRPTVNKLEDGLVLSISLEGMVIGYGQETE